MENSCFNFQWPINSIDDQFHVHAPFFEYNNEPVMEPSSKLTKQFKTYDSDHLSIDHNLIQICDSSAANQGTTMKRKYEAFLHENGSNDFNFNNLPSSSHGGAELMPSRVNSYAYKDHILAERKRREKLSQMFITLSALVPNLKRLDKASVLGDAIEYLKTLQEKVKRLEEQTSERENIDSVRFKMVVDNGDISSLADKSSHVQEQFPEIEARFLGKDVLIRVHCKKKPNVVEKTLVEIEKLHLSVISSTVVNFADSMLHITVIAQMDNDSTMTKRDFVKNLHLGLKQFM